MRRLLGLGAGGDRNAPTLALVPQWGPDGYARRTAVANTVRANPASPASIGIGVRPAPPGSVTEGTKTDAMLPPQQWFRGMAKLIADPSLKTLKPTASLPSANAQINPVLLAMTPAGRYGRGLRYGMGGG